MKTLAERQADRVIRKAERALADNQPFNVSRAGIGKVHHSHPDAASINKATDAAIARTAEAIGAAPEQAEGFPFATAKPYTVKVGGI